MEAIESRLGVVDVSERKMRRDVGRFGLLMASVGSVIGSGWLLAALSASQAAGPAAIIAWVVGAVIVLVLALVHAELGAMFPVAGGSARFPHYSHGSFAGFSSGWFYYLGAVTVAPVEVLAVLTYATNYLSWLTHGVKDPVTGTPVSVLTGAGYVVAVALLLVFTIINVLGVRWLAEVNKYITYWKIAIPVLAIIVFWIVSFHPGNFSAGGGFLPYGWAKVFSALSLGIIFAYLGFEQAVEFGAESSNPKRNIPFAVIGSMVIGIIVYIALQIAFIGAVNPSSLNKGWSALNFTGANAGPYAALATALGLGWLAFVLYVDAAVSPTGTGLLYVGSSARLSFGMARNRYVPAIFEFMSDRRIPLISVAFAFILGLIFFFPFPTWRSLIGLVTGATVLSYGLQPLALSALRRQLPDQERPFRTPLAAVLSPAAFVVANLIILWTGWDTNKKLGVAILVGFVILWATSLFARPGRKPALDMKGALWVAPYLVGLGVISYIGAKDYDGTSLGLLPFGWDVLVMAVFSLVIYYFALSLRLSAQEAEKNVTELGAAGEAEPEMAPTA